MIISQDNYLVIGRGHAIFYRHRMSPLFFCRKHTCTHTYNDMLRISLISGFHTPRSSCSKLEIRATPDPGKIKIDSREIRTMKVTALIVSGPIVWSYLAVMNLWNHVTLTFDVANEHHDEEAVVVGVVGVVNTCGDLAAADDFLQGDQYQLDGQESHAFVEEVERAVKDEVPVSEGRAGWKSTMGFDCWHLYLICSHPISNVQALQSDIKSPILSTATVKGKTWWPCQLIYQPNSPSPCKHCGFVELGDTESQPLCLSPYSEISQ